MNFGNASTDVPNFFPTSLLIPNNLSPLQSLMTSDVVSFFNAFIFNWRVIALQYCVGFYQTSTSTKVLNSHTHCIWLPLYHFASTSNVTQMPVVSFRIVFADFFIMNLILWGEGSSAAIPFGTLVAILALWFCISVPLTFIGAYFGFKKNVSL